MPYELTKVMEWLKAKHVDDNVIKVIDDLQLEQLRQDELEKAPTDPWRALHTAYAKVNELRDALDKAVEAKDNLEDKKEDLEADVKDLQQRALSSLNGSDDEPKIDR